MHKQWMGCAVSNFRIGRAGFHPEAIVIHRTGGTLAEIDARFHLANSFSSAHYAVGKNGDVQQYVEEQDTAFHAGIVVNATWTLIKPGKNPNLYTIAIEEEGSAGEDLTDAQYEVTAALLAEIRQRWNITANSQHVVLHSEIRTDRDCPGDGFDRSSLLNRLPAAQNKADGLFRGEIRILKNANVRAGSPSSSVRIVRVAPADSTEMVAGFTDQGERVHGNSYWHRTEDANYFWAGATYTPNPVVPSHPEPVPVAAPLQATEGVVRCGIQRIDDLFTGALAPPINSAETDAAAIGAVQDLLTGLCFPGLPTLLSSTYGIFGQKTTNAIRAFQISQSLNGTGSVDSATLQKMVSAPATDPRASQVYLTLVLRFSFTSMQRILSLVAQMEGGGKFAALNPNSDCAGLSFGLIQWAQKPGRLADILSAFSQADRDEYVRIFGDGDPDVGDALIAHCKKPSGGVNPKTGETTNPSFNLITEPWFTRFKAAAFNAKFQQVQVVNALQAFEKSYDLLCQFAADIISERGVGFMIDVANQFGDAGARKLYSAVHQPEMSEKNVLEAIADESVARVGDTLKAGVRARRDRFLESRFLSDQAFAPNVQVRAVHT
jgi:peptidoglycan hydrolase-like protein with peptidoglycan-binding domain